MHRLRTGHKVFLWSTCENESFDDKKNYIYNIIDHIIQSIKSNCRIQKDDGKIGGIFVQPPTYASKQPPNLRLLLIRNTITDDEPECNKPCGKYRFNVCKQVNTATKVFINHKTVKPGNYN